MSQDRESGAKANKYGRITARKIAVAIGAKSISKNSNEFELDGKHITIRCARSSTTKFGVTFKMLKRVDLILGAIEQDNGIYDIYTLLPNVYETHMTDTKSKGAAAGKVGMISRRIFQDEGDFFCSVDLLKKREEIDRFIAENVRIRRCIQVYTELFTEKVAVDILTDVSSEVFAIIQRSMHDEILISVKRLFEGKDSFTQRYLVLQYTNVLTPDMEALREKTRLLLKDIDIGNYRRKKIAHNDIDAFLGSNEVVKHNVHSDTLISLIDTSLELAIKIKGLSQQSETISLPVRTNDRYTGKGKSLINKLMRI